MGGVWHRWGTIILVSVAGLPVAALVAGTLAWARRGAESAWRDSLAEVAAVAGTLPWLWMILTPRPAARTVDVVPLRDLFQQPDLTTAVVQLGGNLLVFAAFGFFAPIRWRLTVYRVALIAAAGSVTVETLQYILDLGRVSSVNDVLLNTTGAVLAAAASRRYFLNDRSGTVLTRG
jgi:hypothetical protein